MDGHADSHRSNLEIDQRSLRTAVSVNPSTGSRKAERILQHSHQNRITSKLALKHQSPLYGAPGTQAKQGAIINNFRSFLSTLNKDLEACPGIDEYIRFVVTLIEETDVRGPGKTAVSETTLFQAWAVVCSYSTWRWREFSAFNTPHLKARVRTLLDQQVRAGHVWRGRFRRPEWVGVVLLHHMCSSYLTSCLSAGVSSWDVALHDLMTVVLQAALGCQSGDIAVSQGYSNEYCLKYLHLTITLEGEPSIENLLLAVDLRFTHGKKNQAGEVRTVHIQAQHDPKLACICPVRLVLVHVFRHGLVAATTLPALLRNMLQRADKKLVWLYPDRPVICQRRKGTRGLLDLDKPASATRATKVLRQLSQVAGVTSKLQSGDLLRGAAQDMPDQESLQQWDNAAQVLGYDHSVVDTYLGDNDALMYNLRTADMPMHRNAPKVITKVNPLVSPLRPSAVTAEIVSRKQDPNSLADRRAARTRLHAKAFDELRANAVEAGDVVRVRPPGPDFTTPLPPLSGHPNPSTTPTVMRHGSNEHSPAAASALPVAAAPHLESARPSTQPARGSTLSPDEVTSSIFPLPASRAGQSHEYVHVSETLRRSPPTNIDQRLLVGGNHVGGGSVMGSRSDAETASIAAAPGDHGSQQLHNVDNASRDDAHDDSLENLLDTGDDANLDLASQVYLEPLHHSLQTDNIDTINPALVHFAYSLLPDFSAVPEEQDMFIERYASINVFRNDADFDERDSRQVSQRCASGFSRDEPRRFSYKCQNHYCLFSTFRKGNLQRHMSTCKAREPLLSTTHETSRRVKQTPISTSLAGLKPHDAMLIKWREEGRPWKEVEAEWERLTGKKPGKDSLKGRIRQVKKSPAASYLESDQSAQQSSAAQQDDSTPSGSRAVKRGLADGEANDEPARKRHTVSVA